MGINERQFLAGILIFYTIMPIVYYVVKSTEYGEGLKIAMVLGFQLLLFAVVMAGFWRRETVLPQLIKDWVE